jgi:formate--tetrahydrofolate ligase
MMLLLNDALMPNLVQTTEGAPAIVHCGPFANIAHGTSSVLAQRIGLHLADYVVNETGFAADLGAEKFFDLVMPMCGHVPSAAAVIVTLKALRAQGGSPDGPVELGFPNLARHFDNLKRWGVQPVIALNRFPGDTDDDLQQVLKYCRTLGAEAAISEGYGKGGDGMTDLAAKIVAAADQADPERVRPIYTREEKLADKITSVATHVYGATTVSFKPAAKSRLAKLEALGYGKLPVCIAKTQYSFTDDPKMMGAPVGWTLTISDVTLSAGAGFVVAIAGAMMLMPGLGKVPQAQKLDVDDHGRAIGMDY